VEFFKSVDRFSKLGFQTFDHWRNEKLEPVTVANTPANLLKINKIFSFHSSFMQNIIDFRENAFSIHVLTQPFAANNDRLMPAQSAVQAGSIFRQYLTFLHAAREWDMDFIDFSKFEILPGSTLRLGWELQEHEYPAADSIIPLFNKNRHLHFLDKGNYLRFQNEPGPVACPPPPAGCLFRSDDFASNLLHSDSMLGIKANANLKIKINTKEPRQADIIQNTLFHNLDSRETLFLKIAVHNMSVSDFFGANRGRRQGGEKTASGLVREFGRYLKQSVFQRTIILIDGLEKQADGQFLRYLLESGDISGLIVILFNSTLHLDCDLELNEDPSNPMQNHFSGRAAPQKQSALSKAENELLKLFAIIAAPVPNAVARALVGPRKMTQINALLKKEYLQEKNQCLCLRSAAPLRDVAPREKKAQLASLAAKTEWPYLIIRHFLASKNLPALEQYLKTHAGTGPEKIAPGPACDLLVSHLPQLAKNQKLIIHFLEIAIRTNSLDLAERILREYAEKNDVLVRLQTAHLAMRKKEYPKLARLLSALGPIPAEYSDLWFYLNFIALEKASETARADALVKKIRDPYFCNLAMIQRSDRDIYHGDYAKARLKLEQALAFFQARHSGREEIEIQSQMAKLQREMGCFAAAESLYKSVFVKSESEGFRSNSAFTAVDLGNLYLENNEDFLAESWYQKALKLFAKEKNNDGIMLVNSNRINILISEGNWKEAENLLHVVLAGNEEKKLAASCAIDCLNWAYLETLRLNNAPALNLLERATRQFAKIGNNKGLAECAFLRCQLFFLESRALDPQTPGVNSFSGDQKALWNICRTCDPSADAKWESAILKQIAAIESKKIRFAALAMLLRKYKKKEWLEPFREISRALSENSKNYFYYESEYLHFELTVDPGHIDGLIQERFLAMYDFFLTNKRVISEKLKQIRDSLQEKENRGQLFADARLVENYRQWRLPEDFFSSFLHAINQGQKVNWLVLHIHQKKQLLFRFSNSNLFKELAEEMMLSLQQQPENNNWHRTEIQAKFNSPERLFYPFANTKMTRWPITDELSASLLIAFKDKELYFQDFFARNKDVLDKFSLLFQNFFENEYNIREKLDFIIGTSKKINEMKRVIAQISKVDFSLLITGESGSGKELVAHAVHQLSPRANRPFVSLNAAALPETLLEAELFGFKKGAFSGALENRVGLLEAADRGTFFLDEIADLPLNLQAKMLRVLQEKEIRRLGENKTVPIDIRLISASNQNLGERIMANQFREDLYYRLQDLTIHIPPLRERREDIPLLVAHFLEKFGKQPPDPQKIPRITAMFQNDSFPGNVRELESKIKKLITFDPGLELLAPMENKEFNLKNARQSFDHSLLLTTLNETRWNKNKTAEKLGISRMALFNLLKKHQIKK